MCDTCWNVTNIVTIFCSIYNWLLSVILLKITWILVGCSVLIWLAVSMLIKLRKERAELLTTKIREDISKTWSGSKFERFKYLSDQLYFPSWLSIAIISIGTAFFYWLAHMPYWHPLDFEKSGHFQNLIAIHAGIGAIIFALLIFVAESVRDDEAKDRARVLLRESFLFPLTVTEIASFFIYIWGDVNAWAIVPIVIVAILTVASLWRLLAVLLDKAKFSAKRTALLRDRIDRSINKAAEERIGNSIFLKSLEEEKTGFDFYPFTLDQEESGGRVQIRTEKRGYIVDVRMDRLFDLSKLLETEANENGFSFYPDKAKPMGTSDLESFGRQGDKYKTVKLFVHKKFQDKVSEDSGPLFSFDRNAIKSDSALRAIERLARSVFIIKSKATFSDEMRLELASLNGQLMIAIGEKRLDQVEELKKIYIELAESFLSAMKRYGGGYTYDQAIKERSSIFGGWEEIRWLFESIRDVCTKAIQSNDRKTFYDLAYLPIAIAGRAIESGDQYLFQEFIIFPYLLYITVLDEEGSKITDAVVERTWRYLKETADYRLGFQIDKKASDPKTLLEFNDFFVPIFTTFQSILKTAFDKRRRDDFKTFLQQFSEVFHSFHPSREHPNAKSLEYSLETTTDPTPRAEFEKRLALQKAKETIEHDVELRRQQVILGLSAFIFDECKKNTSDTIIKDFVTDCISYLPKDLSKLTSLYQSARSFETERAWNWDNWESIPDGRVHEIYFLGKIDRLYCALALLLLKSVDDEQVKDINLPASRDFAFLVEQGGNNRGLVSILDSITADPAQWPILDAQAISKVSCFKELLEKASKQQETNEQEMLKRAAIDPEKLEEFKAKIEKAFLDDVVLRPMLKNMGLFIDRSDKLPKESIDSWGYNQIDQKAGFITDWYVHFAGWGDVYGEGMANSEDQFIFEEMIKQTLPCTEATQENFVDHLEKVLQDQRISKPVILETLDYRLENAIFNSPNFTPHFRQGIAKSSFDGCKEYRGLLRVNGMDIPVLDLFAQKDELENKVVVVDLKAFCRLIQYSPINKTEDEKFRYKYFYLNVSDLNQDEALRNKIISENPAWLKEQSDPEGFLRQKVVVKIFQRLKLEIKNKSAAHCFSVSDLAAQQENSSEPSASSILPT